jgi:glycerol-3-phosphate dehydrogenase (NAD(P)+)
VNETPATVAIMGDGQMGLVLASLLAQKTDAPEVRLWGFDERSVNALAQTRTTPRLEGFALPDAVRVVPDPGEAMVGAELLVAASPTQFIRPVWEGFRGLVPGQIGRAHV